MIQSDPHWKTLDEASRFHGKPRRTILRWVQKYQIPTQRRSDGRPVYSRLGLEIAEHKSKHKGKAPEWSQSDTPAC